MGYGIAVRCSHCQHNDNFLLGFGFSSHYPLEEILSDPDFPQRLKNKAEEIIKNSKKNGLIIGNELFVCPSCNTLHEQVVINDYAIKFECEECGTTLEAVKTTDTNKQYKCNECGHDTLSILDEDTYWSCWD
jgi:predicted RNA-binding Zn-ribbon protein involved in translation (DUF1610 family)